MEEDKKNENKKMTVEEMTSENLKLAQEMHVMMQKIRRYMLIRAVVGVIYLILLVAPVILAIIYLPPLVRPAIEQYESLLGSPINNKVNNGANIYDLMQVLQDQNNQ